MRKKSCVIFFILVFGFWSISALVGYAQDHVVLVDSVERVPAETTVTVNVFLKTTSDLSAVEIPLKFYNPNNLEVQCDSIHWSEDWFWANEADNYSGQGGDKSYIDNTEKTVAIYAIWFLSTFPGDDDTLCTIYFTTGPYWYPESVVTIDTFRTAPGVTPPHWLNLIDESAHELEVVFYYGFMGNPSWVREVDVDDIYTPKEFTLGQNYPNPFNPTTVIRFALPEDAWVKVEVFNILGQKITTLVDEYLTAGVKETGWDGKNSGGTEVASGIYFYRIATDRFTDIKKMVLLK